MASHYHSGNNGVYDAAPRKLNNHLNNRTHKKSTSYEQPSVPRSGHGQSYYQRLSDDHHNSGGYQNDGYWEEVVEYPGIPRGSKNNRYETKQIVEVSRNSRNVPIQDRITFGNPQPVGDYQAFVEDQRKRKEQQNYPQTQNGGYVTNRSNYYQGEARQAKSLYSSAPRRVYDNSREERAQNHAQKQYIQQKSNVFNQRKLVTNQNFASSSRNHHEWSASRDQHDVEEKPRFRNTKSNHDDLNARFNQLHIAKAEHTRKVDGERGERRSDYHHDSNPFEKLHRKLIENIANVTGDASEFVPKSPKPWNDIGFSNHATQIHQLGLPLEDFHKEIFVRYSSTSPFVMEGFVDIGIIAYVAVILGEKINRQLKEMMNKIRLLVVSDDDSILKEISTTFHFLGYKSTLINVRFDKFHKINNSIILTKPHTMDAIQKELGFDDLTHLWMITSDSMDPEMEIHMTKAYKSFAMRYLSRKFMRNTSNSDRIKVILTTSDENQVLIDCVRFNFESLKFTREEDGRLQIIAPLPRQRQYKKLSPKLSTEQRQSYLDTSLQTAEREGADDVAVSEEISRKPIEKLAFSSSVFSFAQPAREMENRIEKLSKSETMGPPGVTEMKNESNQPNLMD